MKLRHLFVITAFVETILIFYFFTALYSKTNSRLTVKLVKKRWPIPKLVEVKGWGVSSIRDPNHFVDIPSKIVPRSFCCQKHFLLVIVYSKPSSQNYRLAIRKSWARLEITSRYNVSVYFLLASTNNPTLQRKVFYNLTLKSLMMLKLVKSYCSNEIEYLFKVDEDSLINLGNVTQMLVQEGHPDLLLGYTNKILKPCRQSSKKWYAPFYLYPESSYPVYLDGSGYLMSIKVAEKLYQAALKTQLFHLEDVYVTGICAKKAGVVPVKNQFFIVGGGMYDRRCFHKYYLYNHLSAENIINKYTFLNECH